MEDLGSAMENGHHSTMKQPRVKRWAVSAAREADGGASFYRMEKLALAVEMFKFVVEVYVAI